MTAQSPGLLSQEIPPNASAMPDSLTLISCQSLRCFGLLLFGFCRSLILAALPVLPVRHLLVTPAALVGGVVLFGHVGVGVGLEVFVKALVVFVS